MLKELGASLLFEKGIEGIVMWYLFSKTYPSFLTVKEGFSKIIPSFFTIKEGSTSHPDPLSSEAREETALLGARNRCALRLADHQRSSPYCAGWDRLGELYFLNFSIYKILPRYIKTGKDRIW